jgi:hypothetical protein
MKDGKSRRRIKNKKQFEEVSKDKNIGAAKNEKIELKTLIILTLKSLER